MIHPLFRKNVYLYIYFILWIPLWFSTVAVLVLNNFTDVPTALFAGFLNNFVFAVIGIGLWYVTLYSNANETNFTGIIIGHFTFAIVVTALWIFIVDFLMGIINTIMPDGIINSQNLYASRVLIGIIYYAILTLFYYTVRYYHESKNNKVNEEKLTIMLREAELNSLKSQINPHFLFNSLNSISMLTLSDPGNAREMLVKLSDFIRYALKQKDLTHSTCLEELDNINKYLEIEKVRFGDKLQTKNIINEACLKMKIPVMILQPLFENAVKHGVYESITPVEIQTSLLCDSDFLYITISNNFDPEAVTRKGEGIGMKNVSERLKIEYGRDDLFSYEKQKDHFIVDLKIPIN
ncbi:MAG: histidine kinase [Bacteroidales bacterium]|nr:histidine kinase [Bacteroidales bacterium]